MGKKFHIPSLTETYLKQTKNISESITERQITQFEKGQRIWTLFSKKDIQMTVSTLKPDIVSNQKNASQS